MINIFIEGNECNNKKNCLKEIQEHYQKKYKVGYTNKIDKNSKGYKKIINNLNNINNTINNKELNVLAKYVYIRKKQYKEKNDINIFYNSYISYFTENIHYKKTNELYGNNLYNYIKQGEKQVDLLVLFRPKGKEITESKKNIKKFYDYIRYNNSEYRLLTIDPNENFEKVKNKIDEIILDNKKDEDTKWYELYKIDVEEFEKPDDYFTYKLKYKKKLVNRIIKYAKNKKVLEAGCGTGLTAGYIQKKGLNVTALDLSQEVLDYAKLIATGSSVISPCSDYHKGDILNFNYENNTFDVVFSNGVLEHFSDKDIVGTLKQQMNISKYVIFGIPSTYFGMNEKMLGNERSLTSKEWKRLIEKSGGKVVEETSFHYYKTLRRILEIKKWFKPKAFLLYIITKKEN